MRAHVCGVSVPRRRFPKCRAVSTPVIGRVGGSRAPPGKRFSSVPQKMSSGTIRLWFSFSLPAFHSFKGTVIASSSALNHWEEMETFVTCNIFAVTITTSAESAPFYPILLSMSMDDLSVLPHGFFFFFNFCSSAVFVCFSIIGTKKRFSQSGWCQLSQQDK